MHFFLSLPSCPSLPSKCFGGLPNAIYRPFTIATFTHHSVSPRVLASTLQTSTNRTYGFPLDLDPHSSWPWRMSSVMRPSSKGRLTKIVNPVTVKESGDNLKSAGCIVSLSEILCVIRVSVFNARLADLLSHMRIAVHIIKSLLLKLCFIATTVLFMYLDAKNKLSGFFSFTTRCNLISCPTAKIKVLFHACSNYDITWDQLSPLSSTIAKFTMLVRLPTRLAWRSKSSLHWKGSTHRWCVGLR